MLYVDTSVLVALCLPEAKSESVATWYAESDAVLTSSAWCVTEFASALSIKLRTGQINEAAMQQAWQYFERLCANDLQLLPVDAGSYYRAAIFALDAVSKLRAGDALHLAVALDTKAVGMATLDDTLANNAKSKGLVLVEF